MMYKIRLTRPDGTRITVTANYYVEKFLWNNYYTLGFNEIENLTNMGIE